MSQTEFNKLMDTLIIVAPLVLICGLLLLVLYNSNTFQDFLEERKQMRKAREAAAAEAALKKGKKVRTSGEKLVTAAIAFAVAFGVALIGFFVVAFTNPCLLSGHQIREEAKTIKPVSCVEDGEYGICCKVCEKVLRSEVVPASEEYHLWGEEKTESKENSCEVTKVKTCATCGEESRENVVDPNLHKWGEYVVVDWGSGCTVFGEKVRTCSVCGRTEEKSTPPPYSHNYGEWEFDSRTEKDFVFKRSCARCGDEQTKTEPRHKTKCGICNGTGSVRYYYGDSDLQAYLDGYDPFTVGECTTCKGTGKSYADYPWE